MKHIQHIHYTTSQKKIVSLTGWLILTALLFVLLNAQPLPIANAAENGSKLESLFGQPATNATEMQKAALREWRTWNEVLAKMEKDGPLEQAYANMPKPVQTQWQNVLKAYSKAKPLEKLRLISGFFNNWDSKDDKTIYGQEEYWASASEFLKNSGGDCEDFVIVKYQAMRLLGWPENDMWLVLVLDNTRRQQGHAILAVRIEGTVYIVDNLTSPGNLVLQEQILTKQYTPLAAMNKGRLWLFPRIQQAYSEKQAAHTGKR